ncbi:MAG: hypothetical protein M1820_010005 [Bogoriella megaspora]|nr:MAG: hypothetical protein M1820_010005 [Bogoriella megaspora]
MSEENTSEEIQVTFNVKSSSEGKYVLTLPLTTKISDVKQKLSTSEYADTPPDRQRLIYSGRVMKDDDTLGTYKVKDGNTVHLVKSAASNARQNPASQGTGTSTTTGPATGAPSNIASGPGTNPLNNLTGARFAGYGPGLPSMDMFGPDGGMGGQNVDDMLRQLDNPMVVSQITEAMNNPDFIRMMRESPMVRGNPMMEQMIDTPFFRQMITNPDVIRSQLQMQRNMAGNQSAFPAPGATDQTPQGAAATAGSGQQGQQQGQNQAQNPFPQLGMNNPFLMGGLGGGNPMAAGGNPFAALFGGQNQPTGSAPASAPQNGQTTDTQATNDSANPTGTTQENATQQGQTAAPLNPFGNLGARGAGGNTPFGDIMQQMMQNPQMMQNMQEMMQGMYGGGANANPNANPFAALGGLGGLGGLPGLGGGQAAAQQPQDTRPPEEQYAEQLRQLNEMGFYEFERNVTALRRAGGNVHGAVEILLSGGI